MAKTGIFQIATAFFWDTWWWLASKLVGLCLQTEYVNFAFTLSKYDNKWLRYDQNIKCLVSHRSTGRLAGGSLLDRLVGGWVGT